MKLNLVLKKNVVIVPKFICIEYNVEVNSVDVLVGPIQATSVVAYHGVECNPRHDLFGWAKGKK